MRGDSVSERDSNAAAAVLAKAATIRTSEDGGPTGARPIIRVSSQPEAAAQRPLRDLATGALWDEGDTTAQRTSSDPSPTVAGGAAPFGRRARGALRTSISEPEPGHRGGTVLGLPAHPGVSPPLSSSGGGGPTSPRSAGGISRGEEQPLLMF